MYAIGKTGTGKTTWIETLVKQDIERGEGLAVLDPHGDMIEKIHGFACASRPDDVVYLDTPDSKCPLGINPVATKEGRLRARSASGLLDAFKRIWGDSWGPRLEHILRNTLLTLIEIPDSTLADAFRLLDEPTFRKQNASLLTNSAVRRFWLKEYEGYPMRLRAEAIAPLQNKLGAFLTNPILNRVLISPLELIDIRNVMDERKILLVNLSKGRIGADASGLLGALIVSEIMTAGLGRADDPVEQRREFFVYLDEFHSISGLALAVMLAELRKYRVGLVLAHQYLDQLDDDVRSAVFGNVGTVICFRVGAPDARILEEELFPEFRTQDLVSLPNRHIYVKLMIDGQVSRPFSAVTVDPTAMSKS